MTETQPWPATPQPPADSLNLASFLPRSRVNGPGERAVLWLQGCALRCPGCYNPAFLQIREAERFPVAVVAEVVLAVPGIEGVTFSGGEPTLQAAGLAALSHMLRQAGLSVMCYTGYRYEQLLGAADPAVRALLDHVDLLVDGPYERDKQSGGRWRGSANQRLIALSGRYRELATGDAAAPPAGHEVEVVVGSGAATWTGVLPTEVTRWVERLLHGGSMPPGES